MNRKKKVVVLILLSLSVFFVYNLTDKKITRYITLGDSFSKGENSYGGYTYGYEDYLQDFIRKTNKVDFIDIYSNKNENITSLYNNFVENEREIINGNNYNIKKILAEANIVTISIGLNDIIYEVNVDKNVLRTQYKEDKIVDYTFNKFKKLMNEVLKYSTNNIYIIGYPERNNEYKYLIRKLNQKYKKYCKKEKIYFINTNIILDKEQYFDQKNSIFPNTKGYEKIAKKIINIYKNKEKS